MANWAGHAAFHLRPLHERLLTVLRARSKLFADEMTVPVLDPSRGRTKTGEVWAYAADGTPWRLDPPASPMSMHPTAKPSGCAAILLGVLQVDGYNAHPKLAKRGEAELAFCWKHVRRNFYELAAAAPLRSRAKR
nr:IS66 family transposase [Bradyrhizobium sp. 160]